MKNKLHQRRKSYNPFIVSSFFSSGLGLIRQAVHSSAELCEKASVLLLVDLYPHPSTRWWSNTELGPSWTRIQSSEAVRGNLLYFDRLHAKSL